MKSPSINLAKRKTNIVDDLTKWALTFGRLLVIIVEIIAFSAFIYRFYLDRLINDLNDEIEGKQAIVASLKTQEELYRNTQARIALAKELTKKSGTNINVLNDIVGFTPPDITFSTFSINDNKLSIEANIGSVTSLTTFLNSLREHPSISSASVVQIENTTQAGAIRAFIISTLKEGELQ